MFIFVIANKFAQNAVINVICSVHRLSIIRNRNCNRQSVRIGRVPLGIHSKVNIIVSWRSQRKKNRQNKIN